ncbi:MAG TPA: cation:proton antiporter [Candidatus Angelobacter sp.]|nr:cation:proton antiporter [Candidatus Angelobacter sp.]
MDQWVDPSGAHAAQFLELGITLVALGLLARVSSRVGMSAVPLFLLAGLFFGRGGALDLGFSDPFLRTSSELGALLLLLLLGLEYSAQELLETVQGQKRAGLLDLLLNAAPGAVAGLLLGWGAVGVVTLAGVTYISSSGIVAQVVRDLGWSDNPESGRVVGLLVVEDLVMAPYLPALIAVASGAGLVAGLVSVTTAVVVVALTLALALRRRHVLSRLVIDADHPLSLVLLVLGATLAAAGIATFAGVSSAVAAFLVGLLLSGDVAERARTALEPMRDLFAALFFLFFGLATDPRLIPGVLLPALLLAAVTIGTKFLVGLLAVGRAEPGAWVRAGALLSARGEFSIVVAGIVTASAAVPAGLDALAATYVMITAVTGPVLARLVRGDAVTRKDVATT